MSIQRVERKANKEQDGGIVVAILLLVIVGAINLAIRFNNPALTETQLFLRYWPHWVLCTTLIAVACFAVSR
jgi:hypothetical protein